MESIHSRCGFDMPVRLVSDESGHTYAIPAGLTEQFYAWVLASENDEDYEGEDFDCYRLSHSLSSYVFDNMRLM